MYSTPEVEKVVQGVAVERDGAQLPFMVGLFP